jgi:DNA-binding NtrC family response regulator
MATRILIADDDPIHRRNLEELVMRMGYRTILADGGASALSFVSQRKDIVLMLLDLSMPDMDGLTVLRRMREAGNSVPVIVLVQNDDLQPVLQAMKMGAVDFVTKPVAFERVQVSVSNVLKIDTLNAGNPPRAFLVEGPSDAFRYGDQEFGNGAGQHSGTPGFGAGCAASDRRRTR